MPAGSAAAAASEVLGKRWNSLTMNSSAPLSVTTYLPELLNRDN